MAENLKVTRYRNGDAIRNVTDGRTWTVLTFGGYCEYDNYLSNVATYGRLYNWYAVSDSRSIAPTGWHVPTETEWRQLEMTLGMSRVQAGSIELRGAPVGGKLKEAGTTHWSFPNTGATNESGFCALPGGFRSGDYDFEGSYSTKVYHASFWSSTEVLSDSAWFRSLYCSNSSINRNYREKTSGLSVRCVRD